MPIYNLIEYSDNCLKISENLWQVDPNDNIAQSESFKSKIKITGKNTAAGNTKDVEIIVPLKYLRNFWRTVEMSLINCKVNLILTWPPTCVISFGEKKIKITKAKLYVLFVTLSTQGNTKLLEQLKFGFKRTINWNKYESNTKKFAQNRYLNDLLIQIFKE